MGSGSPPLLWSFPPTATFTSFPAPGCWSGAAAACAFSSRLVYLQFCEGFPSPPSVLRVPCPLCYVSFLLLLIIQFLFFPWVGGRSVQGTMLIWPRVVCGSTVYCLAHFEVHIFPSHLDTGVWWPGTLLISLFNVKWRCYAWTGDVEESKFCLFLVIFPLRCISSISPRFYFRKHTFCFLPLVAILESSLK
jgi:hypothetical protein